MNVVSETDKINQLSSLSHCHFIDVSLISQCTWHRLTCLARWIRRGSRIMRSNTIGTFLLEDRNVIKDVPAWHPPSPLLHDPHHAINSFCYEQPELFTTVRFTTNNISLHWRHPSLVPAGTVLFLFLLPFLCLSNFTQTPWQEHQHQHSQCTAVRGGTLRQKYSHQIFYGGL